MKKLIKNPLFISMIVSSVIIVISLFILGFFGMNLGSSLAGGSQFEITLDSSANTSEYVKEIKSITNRYGEHVDTAFVEDKYIAGDNEADLTTSCLVIKLSNANISEETKSALLNEISSELNIDNSLISNIETVTGSIEAKSVLMLGLAVGIIAIALFVFAWIRYGIFAGLTFIIAFLHNIILYLSVLICTRVELGLMSLSVALVLTLLMSAVLIHIFEKYREEVNLHLADKMSVTERMKMAEKQTIKPYLFFVVAAMVVIIMLLFVPVNSVRFTSLNIFLSLIITIYTTLIVGPAVYANLLEIKDFRQKSALSRNDELNKEIKKKIQKNNKKNRTNKIKSAKSV